MSDLYEEYGLEQEGDFGADPKLPTDKPKKVKKGGGWLGRIIAFLLGIVLTVGCCAGVIFAIITQPVRTIVGFAGMDFDTQVKDTILGEEYGDKTLLQLSQDALNAAIAKDLAGLDRVFPMVGVYVGELADKMRTQFGVELDTEEMLNTHLDMLPEYLGEKFKTTPLSTLLEDRDDAITMYLLYGKKGAHYIIDDNGEIQMQKQRIAIYDAQHIYNEYTEQLQEKTQENKGYVIDLAALTYVDVNGKEYTLEATTDTLNTPNGEATWHYLKQNGEYTLYPKSTIADLPGTGRLVANFTSRMTVGEFFGADADKNPFLKHLKNSTINDLPDAVSNLTVGQVFEDDIYEDGTLKGQWKYLLTEKDSGTFRDDYKIATDMNKLLDNMTANIHKASLSQLVADEVIAVEDENVLNTPLRTSIGGSTITLDADTLGVLTASELLDYVAWVLGKI